MKRYTILVLILLVTLISGCSKTASDTEEEITLEENQSLTYGQISEIAGNEITYTVAEEVSAEEMQNMGPGSQSTTEAGEDTTGQSTQTTQAETSTSDVTALQSGGNASGTSVAGTGNTASQTSQSGQSNAAGNQFPSDQTSASESGTPPQMPTDSGNMPTDQTNVQSQETSSSDTESNSSSSSDNSRKTEDRVMYKLTDEVKTTMIPVGTAVITKLGTTTTFSRLAAGDTIKMLIEKDGDTETILKIWIVG